MLQGIGASQGYGIGKAVIIEDINLDYSAVKYTTAQEEKARLAKAVEAFTVETRAMAEGLKASAGEKEAEILEGHLTMLADPFMLSQMNDKIDGGAVKGDLGEDARGAVPEDGVAEVAEEVGREVRGVDGVFQHGVSLQGDGVGEAGGHLVVQHVKADVGDSVFAA